MKRNVIIGIMASIATALFAQAVDDDYDMFFPKWATYYSKGVQKAKEWCVENHGTMCRYTIVSRQQYSVEHLYIVDVVIEMDRHTYDVEYLRKYGASNVKFTYNKNTPVVFVNDSDKEKAVVYAANNSLLYNGLVVATGMKVGNAFLAVSLASADNENVAKIKGIDVALQPQLNAFREATKANNPYITFTTLDTAATHGMTLFDGRREFSVPNNFAAESAGYALYEYMSELYNTAPYFYIYKDGGVMEYKLNDTTYEKFIPKGSN